jgi:dihydroxyacid dehydratase/phosphogluconate dehydratase
MQYDELNCKACKDIIYNCNISNIINIKSKQNAFNIGKIVDGDIIEIDIPARTINVRLTDEELAARPMTPVTRDRYVPKSLKAYASMVSSADKGAVRIID